jgi:hypothetical protein
MRDLRHRIQRDRRVVGIKQPVHARPAGLQPLRHLSLADILFAHVLLVNPLYVVEELRHKQKSRVSNEWWNAYIARASVTGAVLPSDEEEEDD